MSEAIDINVAARKLAKVDNVLILCHKNPDGDTLGSAGALYWALHSLGKKAAVFCSDPIHERYQYMELEQFYDQFEPQYVVAVDIAGTQLFGERSAKWADKVDMCIDHHGSNTGFADQMLLDATAAATPIESVRYYANTRPGSVPKAPVPRLPAAYEASTGAVVARSGGA